MEIHLQNAKLHGVSKNETVEIITHIAFYVGAERMGCISVLRKIYAEDKANPVDSLFGIGEPNVQFTKYFIGSSYLIRSINRASNIFNVMFESGCRNDWHIHHAGGQVLFCTDGEGWFQEWGEITRKLFPGDVVYIKPEVRHCHGATRDSWFTHISIEVPAAGGSIEWLMPVDDGQYPPIEPC